MIYPPTEIRAETMPAFREILHRATRRVRFLRARSLGANGLLFGSAVSAALLLAVRLRLLDGETFAPEWLLIAPVLGLTFGIAWGYSRPVPPLALLRFLEQKLDLKERFSTALAAANSSTSPAATTEDFLAQQRKDAEGFAARGVELTNALPYRPVPRRIWGAGFSALGVFLLWFVPTLPIFLTPLERAEKAELKKEGERIVRIARALEKDADAKKLENARKSAQKLAALGEEMKKGRLSRQKALMKAAKLTDEMKQAQQQAAAQTAPKSLPSAAKEFGKALTMSPGGAKAGESGDSQKLNPPSGNSGQSGQNGKNTSINETLNAAQKAMAQNNTPSLMEQLSKLADKTALGEPGDKAGRDDLAGKLSALAKSLEGTSLSKVSEPLQEAAEALKNGDMARASEKLREAARRAAESAKSGEEAQAMQKMADALSGQSGESSEGEMSDSGEGTGEDDSFDKEGQRKDGHVHTAECLQPGGTRAGSGNGTGGAAGAGQNSSDGNSGSPSNGIGSGAGTPDGKKREAQAAKPYAAKGPDGNKYLNRKTETHSVRNDAFDRIFAPDGKMPNTRVSGKRGENGKETVSYFRGTPDKAEAGTPYYEVYSQYAPAAENALNRDDIPASYKKQVKTYFDSLTPVKASGTGEQKSKGQ